MERLALLCLLVWATLAAALALSPFSFEWRCLICTNGARVETDPARLVFPTPGLARAELPPGFNGRLAQAGTMTIEMSLAPARTSQSGPARIVTSSAGPYSRNFTIAQDRDALVLRFRTGRADRNGRNNEVTLPGVFSEGREIHLLISHDTSGTDVNVRGMETNRVPRMRADFSTWNDDFELFLGNESTGDRPWIGAVSRLVIRAGPDAPALVDLDFGGASAPAPGRVDVSDLQVPALFLRAVPLRGEAFQAQDLVLHAGMLLPIGLLSMLAVARERHGAVALAISALVVLGYALAVEVAQHFTVTRTMSALDFLWGALGGGLGLAAGLALRRLPGR